MSEDENKGIANLLAEYKTPERTPKVKTQENPLDSFSESLMRMKPLDLSRSEPKREFGGGSARNDIKKDNDLRYNHNNPRHRKEVEEYLTRDTSKSKGMWNAYISADKDPNRPKNIPALDYTELMKKKHGSYDNYTNNSKLKSTVRFGVVNSSKKIGTAPQGSEQQKTDILNYVNKVVDENEPPKIANQKIFENNINRRYVNKSLNNFENRTDNKNIVTFNPTTQLFTDSTRNIAFKSYEDAKRWNDSINEGPTKQKVMIQDESKLNQPKRRQ